MAAQEKFPVLVAGQWVSIAERIDTRKSLIVSMIGGACVLGITQAAPMVASAFGTIPAGIFLQGGDVSGPGLFRASFTIDDELVVQEWYAWLVPGTVPGEGPVEISMGDNLMTDGGGGYPYSQSFTNGAATVCLVVFSVFSVNTGIGVSSAAVGVLAAVATTQVEGGDGNTGYLQIFQWAHPGGTDTLTFTSSSGSGTQFYLYVIPSPASYDVNGNATGAGNPVSVAASSPLTSPAEIAIAGYVGEASSAPGDPWPGIFTPLVNTFMPGENVLLNWSQQLAWVAAVAGPLMVSATQSPTPGNWASAMVTFTQPPNAFGAVVAVFESWEEVVPDPPLQTFPVELPRLSPKAMELLRELNEQVRAKAELGQGG